MSDFGYGNGLGYGEAQGGGFYRFEVRNAFMSHRLAGAHCLPFSVDFRFYLVLAYSFAFGNVFLDDAVVDRLFSFRFSVSRCLRPWVSANGVPKRRFISSPHSFKRCLSPAGNSPSGSGVSPMINVALRPTDFRTYPSTLSMDRYYSRHRVPKTIRGGRWHHAGGCLP